MLIYNLRRVMQLRGIDKPHRFLTDNGFANSSASAMMAYYPRVFKVKTFAKLCFILNCTPNDLFEWRDVENEAPLPETHPLNALRREAIKNFSEIIKNLPLERMGEVESFLQNLKDEKSRPE